jgi:hypothetical protein
MSFEGYEDHEFVWLIMGDTLYYSGTYGGVCEKKTI